MNLERGDLVVLKFPFANQQEKIKVRPALVVQNDIGNRYSANTIVIMVTSSVPKSLYPILVLLPDDTITGLDKPSVADAGVIFTVSRERIQKHIGKCPQDIMQKVDEALRISLNL